MNKGNLKTKKLYYKILKIKHCLVLIICNFTKIFPIGQQPVRNENLLSMAKLKYFSLYLFVRPLEINVLYTRKL